MIGTGSNGDDWRRELLTIILMVTVGCIVGCVLWWEVRRNIAAARAAYGAETNRDTIVTVSEDTPPPIDGINQRLYSLDIELSSETVSTDKEEVLEDTAAVSSDIPADMPEKIVIEDLTALTKRKIEVLNMYIARSNPKLRAEERSVVATGLVKYAEAYNLPIGLVAGICRAESNFKMSAQGIQTKYGHAVGAMQVMWPVHEGLAKSLGVKSRKDMFGELGIKVGCHILRNYITNEHSVIGGLKCYLAQLSRVYILEKVTVTYLTIDQLLNGTINEDDLPEVIATETAYMRRLVR